MKRLIDKLALEMLIPLIGNIVIFVILQKNIEVFKICIDFFIIIIEVAVGIFAMVRVKKGEDFFYFNLGVSFIIIGILSFIRILISRVSGSENTYVDIINLVVYYGISIYYNMAFFINKSREALRVTCLTYIFVTGFLFILSSSILLIPGNMFNYKLILIIIMTVISFILINGRMKNTKEKILHIVFISTNFICEFLVSLSGCRLQQRGIFSSIILYLNYYVLFIIISEYFFRYYKKKEHSLIEAQRIQQNLNKILINKNKELLDLNISIEKSEIKKKKLIEVVKGGILMMSFNKITYVNSGILEISCKYEQENLIGYDINYLRNKIYEACEKSNDLSVISHKNILELVNSKKQEEPFHHVGFLKYKESEYEIYYVKLNNFDSVIYLKDITYINKSHRVRGEYYNYLKEEKLKNEFYSNISHELRTPINIIYSAIQLNEVYLEKNKILNMDENTAKIRQNCMRLIRTINNFIDTNKVTEGFLIPNLKIYNIVSIIENIAMSSNRYIEKINNYLVFDPVEEEIYASIDKDMIERVILNLLSNIVKYGKSGGTVYVNINLVQSNIVIVVRNDQYTLSEDIIPYLFDKFSKLNKSFSREKEGSGLGLFLSKALLELQGGSIHVNTDKDSGTKFIITLPRCNYCNCTDVEVDYNLEDLNNRVDIEFSDIYL